MEISVAKGTEFTASPASRRQEESNAGQSPFSDPEETQVLYAALDSFRQYRVAAHYNITHLRRQSFYSLPSAQIDLLSEPPFSLPQTFDDVDDAIDCNADLCEAILEVGLSSFGIDPASDVWHGQATASDMDKARSTVRQFYRDWSIEGQEERKAAYEPIFTALTQYLPAGPVTSRHQKHILVPGAGLGRLVFDLCSSGYSVEGNEISYHQLLASNYILNNCHEAGQHTIYPWALNFSNHLTRGNQLRSYKVPEFHPAEALDETRAMSEVHYSDRMTMTAGDFCVLYRQPEYGGRFDVVTTCFFIDTAPNVISYMETINHCLKAGGLWINLGPLLWHFESAPTPAERSRAGQSSHSQPQLNTKPQTNAATPMEKGIAEPGNFELSDAEVIALACRLGFDPVEHAQTPAGATGYIQDPASMLQNMYRPSFWVARKR